MQTVPSQPFIYQTADEVILGALSVMESTFRAGECLTDAENVKRYFRLRIGNRECEYFTVVFLTAQHQVVAIEDMFRGTIDQASVFPREIVRDAIKYNAAAVLLGHNHPSGIVEPSESDRRITNRIIEALCLLDIRVLDHIVVSKVGAYSFAEAGLI